MAEGLRAAVRTSGKEEAAGEREDGATAKQKRERRRAAARRSVAERVGSREVRLDRDFLGGEINFAAIFPSLVVVFKRKKKMFK